MLVIHSNIVCCAGGYAYMYTFNILYYDHLTETLFFVTGIVTGLVPTNVDTFNDTHYEFAKVRIWHIDYILLAIDVPFLE